MHSKFEKYLKHRKYGTEHLTRWNKLFDHVTIIGLISTILENIYGDKGKRVFFYRYMNEQQYWEDENIYISNLWLIFLNFSLSNLDYISVPREPHANHLSQDISPTIEHVYFSDVPITPNQLCGRTGQKMYCPVCCQITCPLTYRRFIAAPIVCRNWKFNSIVWL